MRYFLLGAAPLAAMLASASLANEPVRLLLTIRDHRFQPEVLRVPANRPLVIEVHNEDPTAEEFESTELGVEKVIAGGRQAPVRVRPLAPGRYTFIGEYHADTARGTIVAEEDN